MAIETFGNEFRVNTYTNNLQGDPSIDANPVTGGFQIVWESEGQDGDGLGVYGQNFNRDGTKDGNEFRISDMTIGDQENVDIAFNENGEGSWVWQTNAVWSPTNIDRDEVPVAADYPAENIRTRSKTFDFESDELGFEYYNFERVRYGRFDSETEGQDGISPRVIALGEDQFATGYFVRDLAHADIHFQVDQYTANTDRLPTNGQWSRNYMDADPGSRPATNFGDLAKFDDRNILVVATLATDKDGTDGVIQFQIFEEPRYQGLAFDLEDRFVLDGSGLTGPATDPRVTMLKDGGFAITWQEHDQTAANTSKWHSDVYVQVFNNDLTVRTPVIAVDAKAGSDQTAPEISALKDGGFIIAWADSKADGKGAGIEAQRFDKGGVMMGDQFVVNSTTRGDQLDPALTTLENGRVVVTWESEFGDGSGDSVMAQQLKMPKYGKNADQKLIGTSLDERFDVGKGKDDVDGGGGKDVLLGGAGNDLLKGGDGKDILKGGIGKDILKGGAGRDTLKGGAGKDRLDGGDGNDNLRGNGGADKFIFNAGRDTILDFQDDVDTVIFSRALVDGGLGARKLGRIVEEGADNLTFDFGSGNVLVIEGINDYNALKDDIGFIA